MPHAAAQGVGDQMSTIESGLGAVDLSSTLDACSMLAQLVVRLWHVVPTCVPRLCSARRRSSGLMKPQPVRSKYLRGWRVSGWLGLRLGLGLG